MIHIKNNYEIEKMRIANAIAAEVLLELSALVAPGLTTLDVDEAAGKLMKKAGVKSAFLGYRNFPGRICISLNEEVVHGIGGKRVIRYGDIVKLDVGIVCDGWVGDTAATIPVGMIDPQIEHLVSTTQAILMSAIPFATPERRLGDLCAHIEERAVAAGYNVVREFVGHGVGSSLHEEPQVPNYGRPDTGPKFKPGMTLAVEPMINMGKSDVCILQDNWTVVTADNSPSAHFEHVILVTTGEPEILTCPRKKL